MINKEAFFNYSRKLWWLAIPNILSNLTVPLVSSVDVSLMGYLSPQDLAAVGISGMIFDFFYWNFGFLRMGTTGFTAQAFGRKDEQLITDILKRGVVLAMVIAVALLVLQLLIRSFAEVLINIPIELSDKVDLYFYMRIWAAPATLCIYVLNGWLIGVQKSSTVLLLTVVGNVVNIGLSAFLVVYMDYGIVGVAAGTVVSQWIGALVGILLVLKTIRQTTSADTALNLFKGYSLDQFRPFLSVNAHLFVRTVLLTSSFIFFYRQSASLSTVNLAVNVLLLQMIAWSSYFIDGLAFAVESLVGEQVGKSNQKGVVALVKNAFLWAMVLVSIFLMVYGFWGELVASIFSSEREILLRFSELKIWLLWVIICAMPSYICDGVFIGMNASKLMRNVMLVSFTGFLLTFYLVGSQNVDNALWIAFTAFFLMRSGLSLAGLQQKYSKVV